MKEVRSVMSLARWGKVCWAPVSAEADVGPSDDAQKCLAPARPPHHMQK